MVVRRCGGRFSFSVFFALILDIFFVFPFLFSIYFVSFNLCNASFFHSLFSFSCQASNAFLSHLFSFSTFLFFFLIFLYFSSCLGILSCLSYIISTEKKTVRASNGQRYPLPCCTHFENLKHVQQGKAYC